MRKCAILFFLIIKGICLYGQDLSQTFEFAENQRNAGNFVVAENAYERVLFFDREGTYSYRTYLALGKCRQALQRHNEASLSLALAGATAPDELRKADAIIASAHSNILAQQYSSSIFDLLSLPQLPDSLEKKKDFYLGVSYFFWNDLEQSRIFFLEAGDTADDERINETFEHLRKKLRNPKKARVLSIFIPGLGQLYNGDVKNALNSFLLTAALGALFYYTSVNFAALDAYLAVFPWFQRYYLGGIRKAYHITETRNRIKKDKAYIELIHIFEK